MSRVLGRFMEWSAGYWIAHHVEKQLPGKRIAQDFIKNIREQGGVGRDELVDFLSEANLNSKEKAILPPNAILEGKNQTFLVDTDSVLVRHLVDTTESQPEGKKFTSSNVQDFLKFVKNECKINDFSDAKKIKSLKEFCAAFDEKRARKEYSFFILKNYLRVIFLKRELEFSDNTNSPKFRGRTLVSIQAFGENEKEYREKLRETLKTIKKIIRGKSSNEENTEITFLEKILTPGFSRYFYLGFIDEKNFRELSNLCNEYNSRKSEFKTTLSQNLGSHDPLHIEIINDTFARMQNDLKVYSENSTNKDD